MDSPVQIPFKSFLQLKRDDPSAVYLQIVFGFIRAIQAGLLPEGTRLPGTRVLCKLLEVNRNTLIKALQDLESQGFIEILPNRGIFILSDQKQKKTAHVPAATAVNATPFTFQRSAILENPAETSDLPYQFNDGQPDIRLVHNDVLARLYVSKLKRRRNLVAREHIQARSHGQFKAHFANFLNLTRGIRIATANLLTAGSHEISLYLAAKLLISPGDKVVVASPGYYLPNMTLADCGAHIIPAPVDEDGLLTHALQEICEAQPIRLLYLTSNYHYPTTACLSAKRRMEVVELANRYGFVILEDDYDYDFHYDNNPVLPLAAFDAKDRVVYVGSFGRSLPAGFAYGFVTGPADFIRELEKHQNILEPGKDVIKEQVLTDWIQDGEVHRLSKKNRKIYQERRDVFVALLQEQLGSRIRFQVPPRGLAVWVEWLEDFNLVKLQKECAARGLFLPKTILYQTKGLTATRIGFGNMDREEMAAAVEILRQSLEAVLRRG